MAIYSVKGKYLSPTEVNGNFSIGFNRLSIWPLKSNQQTQLLYINLKMKAKEIVNRFLFCFS